MSTPAPPASARRSSLDVLWVLASAALLLAPAVIWGRPFVFGDTAYYFGWGGDVLDALRHPWPRPGQPWIPGRELQGWGHALHDTTPADLKANLTWLTARSSFYAVPLHILAKTGGLWLVAALQSLLAAWTIKVAVRAAVPAAPGWTGLAVTTALVAITSLGFETAYAMPDVFGGLCLLAAALLIAFPDRIGRAGLIVLMTYAVLAHAENGLGLAAALAFGALWLWQAKQNLRALAPVAIALIAGLAIASAGRMALDAAFGQPTHMPPFAAARLLADGNAQPYLRKACPTASLAACDLADAPPTAAEHYLWTYPLETRTAPTIAAALAQFDRLEAGHVTPAEADHRARFVAEQGRLILGSLRTSAPAILRTGIANGALAVMNFGVLSDFDTVHHLTDQPSGLRAQLATLLPGGVECPAGAAQTCGRFDLGLLAPVQYAAVLAALIAFLIARIRPALAPREGLSTFIAMTLATVTANALICGAVSGPYARYQSRVVWLIPLAALLLGLQLLERRRAARPQ